MVGSQIHKKLLLSLQNAMTMFLCFSHRIYLLFFMVTVSNLHHRKSVHCHTPSLFQQTSGFPHLCKIEMIRWKHFLLSCISSANSSVSLRIHSQGWGPWPPPGRTPVLPPVDSLLAECSPSLLLPSLTICMRKHFPSFHWPITQSPACLVFPVGPETAGCRGN